MNVHDSEKVRGTLAEKGYTQVDAPDDAGLVLFNTCSIRDKAEQKVFSRLAGLKYRSKNKHVGVLGCVAQHNGEAIFEQAPHVSLVCGSASYNQLPELVDKLEAGENRVAGLELDTDETFDQPMADRGNAHSAYLTIIEGCDKNCSYCVVPFTRGPERSRPSASVLDEARRIAAGGASQITLLGQTVNSYRDPSGAGKTFAQLLDEVGEVEGIRRVRFTTSHPRDFSRDIVDAIDGNPTLSNLVHLPVQSGSTSVLKRMRRSYTRDEYLKVIDFIKAGKRNIALSTDVIVGFPGETEADFEETLTLLQEIEYAQVYSFMYSPRRGTDSVEHADHIPEEEKSRRLQVLQQMQQRIQERRNVERVGGVEEAFVEGFRPKHNQWIGRTSEGRVLNFSDPADLAEGDDLRGSYCQVKVNWSGPNSLRGELASVVAAPKMPAFQILN